LKSEYNVSSGSNSKRGCLTDIFVERERERELSSLWTDKIEKQTATIVVSNVMRIRAIVSLFACQIVNSLIHNGTLCFQHCISTNILDLNALQFLFQKTNSEDVHGIQNILH